MATIKKKNKPKPLTITDFLGLNLTKSGDTQLKLGESGNMTNCYISKDKDLAKIEGYLQLMTSGASKNIQGMWYGYIDGEEYFVFALNGHVYRFTTDYWKDDTTWGTFASAIVDLGTLTDAPTSFFEFNDNLYIENGNEYKKWTGTGTISDVEGHVPKRIISATPETGAGTEYEKPNLLNGKSRILYDADGSTTGYQLPEEDIDSVDYVYVEGELKTVTTDYTVNLTTGVVTFLSIPAIGLNNVEIYYTKGEGDRDVVVKNRGFCLFGAAQDTRVFLYGHTDNINQRINSTLADELPSVEYFIADNIDYIGSSEFGITGIEVQQDTMLLHKQNASYGAIYDSLDLGDTEIVNFPTYIINDKRGNIAFGQAQLLDNKVYTIDSTLINWTPTQNKNERNMKEVADRIQRDLDLVDLSNCKTIDFEKRTEMWISNGKKVWIYNYRLNVFSRLLLEDEPTCWLNINGELYFGTTDGRIMKFSENYLTFNGTAVEAHWEMNMYNFGADYLKKNMNKSWVTLAPLVKSYLDISYLTDNDDVITTETIQKTIITFDNLDFGNFSFDLNYNPKPFRIKQKKKKFTYIKISIDNNEIDSSFVLLNFSMQAEYGGYTK